MTTTLSVKTSTHPYNIYIGEDIRFHLNDFLVETYSSIFIITDDKVAPLYLDEIIQHMDHEHIKSTVLPSGEGTKSIDMYYRLQTELMEHQMDRKSLIVALGGGVIGDLAGFVAATFMRGIDFVQVPTTILAHDSSVGGKVAINHELGKNMIGAFYPPKAVIYDTNTLQSLPNHEIRSGYAELMKEAFIADEQFLHHLLGFHLQDMEPTVLQEHLFKGIKIKADIVEKDEKESNIRMYLNFGHTLAHALESSLGYGKITHGEAVAIGMLFALYVSEKKYASSLKRKEYENWLLKNNYPIQLENIQIDEIIDLMKLDKKAQFGTIKMVLLKKVGKPIVQTMDEQEVKQLLLTFIKEWSLS